METPGKSNLFCKYARVGQPCWGYAHQYRRYGKHGRERGRVVEFFYACEGHALAARYDEPGSYWDPWADDLVWTDGQPQFCMCDDPVHMRFDCEEEDSACESTHV